MPRTLRTCLGLLLATCLTVGPSRAGAQEAIVLPFWDSPHGLRLNAAASLVLARDPRSIAILRFAAAQQPTLWPDWDLSQEEVPALPEDLLKLIKDGDRIPDFDGKMPTGVEDRAFYLLQSRALENAALTAEEFFRKSAEEQKHVQFTQLFTAPAVYRGKVVSVRGELLVLRQFPAPRAAQQQGVKFLYEGWIKGPTKGAHPFCVQFVELPTGLEPGEKIDRQVQFYGYFLKKFSYFAHDANRLTVLLVGKTVELVGPPPRPTEPEQPFSRMVLFAVSGAVLLLTAVAFALSWWFRRGDDRVGARLNQLREKHGLDFTEETAPPPAPELRNGSPTEHRQDSPQS